MKFAYADPPYIGWAKRYYSADPRCAEVDHLALISRLAEEYQDGWALSCSTPSLGAILAMCPPGIRVCAWVKPLCGSRPNVRPTFAWEPVLLFGGRKDPKSVYVRDWIAVSKPMTGGGALLVGRKPAAVCLWILNLLGFEDGDTLDDLFPGTGIMGVSTLQSRLPV